MVYSEAMGATNKSFRQSVSLPARLAKRVKSLARAQRTSTNRVMVDLIENGLEAKEREKERFFALAGRLTESRDPAERERLKKELARMTFGE
jgi:metal-responsive CopG/Arc/MetJ family transcriptional regulator